MVSLMTKREFIPQFLEIIRKKLEKNLPEEAFEKDFIEDAWEIIKEDRGY